MQSFNQFLQIGQQFAKIYYDKMTQGVNQAFGLFNPNVLSTIESEDCSGAYNWLIKMTSAGIYRFDYCNINGTCQPLQNSDILVNIQGKFRSYNFYGSSSNWLQFNETFILGRTGDNYAIKNHIFKQFNQ